MTYNKLQWTAFAFVVLQLIAVANGFLLLSWFLCLYACVLWSIVAIKKKLPALFVQQVIVAVIAGFTILGLLNR